MSYFPFGSNHENASVDAKWIVPKCVSGLNPPTNVNTHLEDVPFPVGIFQPVPSQTAPKTEMTQEVP